MKPVFLRVLFLGMSLAMIAVTVVTSMKSNLFVEWDHLGSQPWVVATLVDFYFNIAIISAWMIYKEAGFVRRMLWLAAFLILGSIATGFYVFLQLLRWKPGEPASKVLLRA